MKTYLLSFAFALFLSTACIKDSNAQTANDATLLEFYQGQRYLEAATYLKSVYKEPITDPVALRNLAYTSQLAGKLVDAEGYYQRLFAIDSTKTNVLNSLAGINLRRGNLVKAGAYYARIIAVDTANFFVLTQLSYIALRTGDTTNYINYLTRGNRVNPEDPDVASDLSNWYVDKKQFVPAESVLNKAIKADTQNVTLLQSLLRLTHRQKKWPETVKTGLQLLQLGDGTYLTAFKLAQAYYGLKNYDCCLEVLANLRRIEQTESSYYYMGMCYENLKKYDKAITYFELAIKEGLSPSIATYYGEMARSYQEVNLTKKALTAYQKGLQFDESPMILYSLAILYDEKLKNKAQAVKYFKKYLSTNPPVSQQALVNYTKSRVDILTNKQH